MNVRHVGILAGLLAIVAIAAPLPSFAETTVIYLDKAPPAPRVSNPPTPTKVGYVWSSGYWNWNGTAYVWTEGNWIAVVEPTKKWVAPKWTQEGNKWYFTAGHWST
jgi:hypothetical protein